MFYIPDSLQDWWEKDSAFVTVLSNKDTVFLPTSLNYYDSSRLSPALKNFKGGSLWFLNDSVKGFGLYLRSNHNLMMKYLNVTDYVNILNPLYDIVSFPIYKNETMPRILDAKPIDHIILQTQIAYEYYSVILSPYRRWKSIFEKPRRYILDGDYIAYGCKSFPELLFIYNRAGYCREYSEIIQYPIILLCQNQTPEEILYETPDLIIYRYSKHAIKGYRLKPFKNGYLMVAGDGKNANLPKEETLDSLIKAADISIKRLLLNN